MKDITTYTHSILKGKPCQVHIDFVPGMDYICQSALSCGVSLFINSSFRLNSDHLQGAIVKPAKHGDHFIGQAIDFNIINKAGVMLTAEQMKNPVDAEVILFFDLIRKSPMGLRWGMDFGTPQHPENADPVHIDSGLYQRDPARWMEIYNSIHCFTVLP